MLRARDLASLPPALRERRKPAPALPPPAGSGSLLVRIAPENTGLFRFLLEAYDHVAYFTVLENRTALLRIIFSPHRERETREALKQMAQSLPFSVEEWPAQRAAQFLRARPAPAASEAGQQHPAGEPCAKTL